jgi:hypothetical protein
VTQDLCPPPRGRRPQGILRWGWKNQNLGSRR